MELASFLAGEKWSDHPDCTHPLLTALARDVNDLTSDSARCDLLPLVTRVIGLDGSDPRVPVALAIHAASAALPIASMERQRALAAGLLGMLAATDSEELKRLGEHALALTPDAERWARGYLVTAGLAHTGGTPAALAILHTSAVGIALACVPDADARLAALLEAAVTATEAILRPEPTAAPRVPQLA